MPETSPSPPQQPQHSHRSHSGHRPPSVPVTISPMAASVLRQKRDATFASVHNLYGRSSGVDGARGGGEDVPRPPPPPPPASPPRMAPSRHLWHDSAQPTATRHHDRQQHRYHHHHRHPHHHHHHHHSYQSPRPQPTRPAPPDRWASLMSGAHDTGSIGFAFYSLDYYEQDATAGWSVVFDRAVQWFMGSHWTHVEVRDERGGTYSVTKDSVVQRVAGRQHSKRGYAFYQMEVTRDQYDRFFGFLDGALGAGFNWYGMHLNFIFPFRLAPIDGGGESYFCSELVAHALIAAGLADGDKLRPCTCSPDDIFELVARDGLLAIDRRTTRATEATDEERAEFEARLPWLARLFMPALGGGRRAPRVARIQPLIGAARGGHRGEYENDDDGEEGRVMNSV